jgi:DNA polymerase III alpha subunit
MICRADTIGVFQIESRAQMSMLPRLRPRCYLRSGHRGGDRPPRPDPGRHGASLPAPPQGREPVSFPKKELEAVLGKTLGVPLFQEQAMNIAIVAGGFSPGEADKLRRAMATFRRVGTIGSFQTKMVEGMVGTATSASSPSIASARSRASANMAFPKATPPASRCWSMSPAGSSAITRMCSAQPSSTPSRWGSMPRRS